MHTLQLPQLSPFDACKPCGEHCVYLSIYNIAQRNDGLRTAGGPPHSLVAVSRPGDRRQPSRSDSDTLEATSRQNANKAFRTGSVPHGRRDPRPRPRGFQNVIEAFRTGSVPHGRRDPRPRRRRRRQRARRGSPPPRLQARARPSSTPPQPSSTRRCCR